MVIVDHHPLEYEMRITIVRAGGTPFTGARPVKIRVAPDTLARVLLSHSLYDAPSQV